MKKILVLFFKNNKIIHEFFIYYDIFTINVHNKYNENIKTKIFILVFQDMIL